MVFGFIFALPDYYYKSWYTPTELTVIAVESRMSNSGNEVYRPVFEAISPAGVRTTYSSKVSNSDASHQVGDVVQGYVNWNTGTMRSQNQIDFSFSMGGLMVALGGLSFLISAFIAYGPRVLAHFRGPPVR